MRAPSLGSMDRRWALEHPTNPSVLRVHVDHELTDRTIVSSPPAAIAHPLAGLLEIEAVRTVDLHRYHARVALRHGMDREVATEHVRDILRTAWGDETDGDGEAARARSRSTTRGRASRPSRSKWRGTVP